MMLSAPVPFSACGEKTKPYQGLRMGRAIDLPGLGAARLGALALFAVAASQPVLAQAALNAGPAPAETPAALPGAVLAEAPSAPPALAQPPAAPVPPGTPQCPPFTAAAAPCIPALTPVKLVIRAHLGSKISLSGQTFAIELAEPIVVDGKELIPAGTAGIGEVVHAKKSGGSGAGGELILAARYLEFGGRRMRLRSLNFAVAGKDSYGTVQSINVASAVAFPALSLIGFFIQGKGIDIPEGVEAMAKTAEPFVLDPPLAAPAATEAATTPVSPPPEQGATP